MLTSFNPPDLCSKSGDFSVTPACKIEVPHFEHKSEGFKFQL